MCEPIFVNSGERRKYTKFYRFDEDDKIVEVDLKQYGTLVFLPAGKKKTNDGKKYFIVYRSTQNFTHQDFKNYYNKEVFICTYERVDWMSANISMGIKFPDKFVAVKKPNVAKENLEKMMQ